MRTVANPLVELRHVVKRFGSQERTTVAVDDVSLSVSPGECVLLLGPSGSGKTTLLTLAAGLTSSTTGDIRLLGRPLDKYRHSELQSLRATRIGFIFQTYRLLDPLSVLENVSLVARFAGQSRVSVRRRALDMLVRLDIAHLAAAYPPHLSQGEKQRVAAARALVNEPELLIADEPTASLESGQALRLVDILLHYVRSRGAGLLIATHDLRLVQYADRTLRIEDGRLADVLNCNVKLA